MTERRVSVTGGRFEGECHGKEAVVGGHGWEGLGWWAGVVAMVPAHRYRKARRCR